MGYQAGVFTNADTDEDLAYNQRNLQRQSTSGEAELMRNSDTMATISKTANSDINRSEDINCNSDNQDGTADIGSNVGESPFASREEFELQDIRFRSSNDSEESMQRIIKPSSALQF